MKFPSPLIKGTLIKRYKRFMADVTLDDGTVVTAHCPNSGAMLGITTPGSIAYLSKSPNEKRKLKYTWEMVESEGTLVGTNTGNPQKVVYEALSDQKVPQLAGYDKIRPEVKYGKNSRIDLLLSGTGLPDCYVEIKNVHLKRGNRLEFPDCVTERGAKHLIELIDMVHMGHRAVMFYCCQRSDGDCFAAASDLDAIYADNFYKALKAGVEAVAYTCQMSRNGILLDRPLSIEV